jgi:hypothetical protein
MTAVALFALASFAAGALTAAYRHRHPAQSPLALHLRALGQAAARARGRRS